MPDYWGHISNEEIERKRVKRLQKLDAEMQFRKDTTVYGVDNKIQVKCISDRIMLYCRYAVDHEIIQESINKDYARKQNIMKTIEHYYHEVVRGNLEFVGVSPIILAAGLVYISIVMNGVIVTQADLAELFVISKPSVRKGYQKIKQYCMKNGIAI